MADGSTSTFIPTVDIESKETEPTEIQTPVIYGEHAPRYVVHKYCFIVFVKFYWIIFLIWIDLICGTDDLDSSLSMRMAQERNSSAPKIQKNIWQWHMVTPL